MNALSLALQLFKSHQIRTFQQGVSFEFASSHLELMLPTFAVSVNMSAINGSFLIISKPFIDS